MIIDSTIEEQLRALFDAREKALAQAGDAARQIRDLITEQVRLHGSKAVVAWLESSEPADPFAAPRPHSNALIDDVVNVLHHKGSLFNILFDTAIALEKKEDVSDDSSAVRHAETFPPVDAAGALRSGGLPSWVSPSHRSQSCAPSTTRLLGDEPRAASYRPQARHGAYPGALVGAKCPKQSQIVGQTALPRLPRHELPLSNLRLG